MGDISEGYLGVSIEKHKTSGLVRGISKVVQSQISSVGGSGLLSETISYI